MKKLTDKLWNFSKKNKVLNVRFFAKLHDTTIDEVIHSVCHLWDAFDNPRVIDNLIHFEAPTKKMFVEVCDTKFKRGRVIDEHNFHDYYIYNKGKEDQHCSVHTHDESWVKQVKKSDKVSGVTGGMVGLYALWLEIDRKNPDGSTSLSKAIKDAYTIKNKIMPYQVYKNLPNNTNPLKTFSEKDFIIWYSGNNSTHLSINPHLFGNPLISVQNAGKWGVVDELAHLVAGDVRYNNGIDNVNRLDNDTLESLFNMYYPDFNGKIDYQMMGQVMENIDSNIYSINSLIRLPHSTHEKSGNKKCLIEENGLLIESSKKLDFEKTTPYLLGWWLKAFDNIGRPEFTKVKLNREAKNKIEKVYFDLIPDFALEDADSAGWCGPYYNPFYGDTIPSAYVSVKTGYLKDHGSERHSLPFDKVMTLWKHEKQKQF